LVRDLEGLSCLGVPLCPQWLKGFALPISAYSFIIADLQKNAIDLTYSRTISAIPSCTFVSLVVRDLGVLSCLGVPLCPQWLKGFALPISADSFIIADLQKNAIDLNYSRTISAIPLCAFVSFVVRDLEVCLASVFLCVLSG
jgi:hypothetical protein